MKLRVRNRKGWAVMSHPTHKKGMIDESSFAHTRKEAIAKFLQPGHFTWEQCQSWGWRVVKVKIYFELITPAPAPEKETGK